MSGHISFQEDNSSSPFDKISQGLVREEVLEILSELKPKEREVISLRFGLVDGNEWTLSAIGKKLKLSRERVRQLQNRALRVLKSKNIGALRDYLAG
ncbi:MAG: sigma-70 family RNA polymerase sigma factor [Xenococcaceae cyanobacterium MO_188.B19]|nr:sigma-70 family RNA polymerase sigma factor [Xenococcaceae cyanobacterium MO_188.B19]